MKGLKISIWGSGVGIQRRKVQFLKTVAENKFKLFLFPVLSFCNTFLSITYSRESHIRLLSRNTDI